MPNKEHCPLWGHLVEAGRGSDELTKLYVSPRTDGGYQMGMRARSTTDREDKKLCARITTWIVDEHRQGNEYPVVTYDLVQKIYQTAALSVTERGDRLLKLIAHKTDKVGDDVEFLFPADNDEARDADAIDTFYTMLAHAECTEADSQTELRYLLNFLKSRLWITFNDTFSGGSALITVAGYAHLADLEKKVVNSAQGFVAMWFDPSMDAAYEHGIHPAIEDAGYKPFRIDRSEHVNRIDDEIVAAIRRSRFLVADFTHGDSGPRGGVYYEAGFAHGLDLPVFWTCREGILKDIHFDIRQYNFIVWNTPQELRTRLAARISAVLGDGPLKGNLNTLEQ